MSSKRSGSPPSKRARQGEEDDHGRAFQGLLRCILSLMKDELPVTAEEEKEEKEEEEEEEEGAGGRGPDWEVLVGHRRELARAVLHLLLAVSRPVRDAACGPAFQRLAGLLQGTMAALETDDGEGRGAAEVVSDRQGSMSSLRQQVAAAGSELREGARLGRTCSAMLDGALRGMDSFMQELQDEMEGDEVGSEGGGSSTSSYGLGGGGDSDRDEEDSNASFRGAGSDSEGDGEEEWDP